MMCEEMVEKEKQFEPCEERWKWRCEGGEKQPDTSGLFCHRMRSWPMLLLRAMSGSEAVQQQGSVSMSVTHFTTKDNTNIPNPNCHLGQCLYPKAEQR